MSSCNNADETELFILDSFAHIFILYLVLSCFFFLFISRIERKALNEEVNSSIKKGLKDYDPPKNIILYEGLQKLSKLYKGEDKSEKIYNEALITESFMVLVTLGFGFFCVWITLRFSCKKCTNSGKIIIFNFLLFICIGIIEYLFFEYFTLKYIPIKPSFVSDVISKNV